MAIPPITFPFPVATTAACRIAVGAMRSRLPKSTWPLRFVRTDRGPVWCAYSIDMRADAGECDALRGIIRLMSEAHWSSPIEIFVDSQGATAEGRLSVSWSSGGINKGYSSLQVAAIHASLWQQADRICQRLHNLIELSRVPPPTGSSHKANA
jgi:hypothetical protein